MEENVSECSPKPRMGKVKGGFSRWENPRWSPGPFSPPQRRILSFESPPVFSTGNNAGNHPWAHRVDFQIPHMEPNVIQRKVVTPKDPKNGPFLVLKKCNL